MAATYPVRQYIVFDAARLLGWTPGMDLRNDDVAKALQGALGTGFLPLVVSLPSARFVPADPMELPEIPPSVAMVLLAGEDQARELRDSVETLISREGRERIVAIGADIGIEPSSPAAVAPASFSFPASVDVGLFATRADAHRLIGAHALPPDLDGGGVNVVVVDSGLDSAQIPGPNWGGGWQPLPGGPLPGATRGATALHGMMVARNVLAVAPRARIWDVPIIAPPRINAIGRFLAVAEACFDHIVGTIGQLPGPAQQWVFVNAWTIFDRRSEVPLGDYTENRPAGSTAHPFIDRIGQLAAHHFDMVFCAGNCGGVCPEGRCGPNDFGPGRSIWGANAHPAVLTVGAVRTDGSWCGYSSEGPGPKAKLAEQKPDLCVPSDFVENTGHHPANRGTSAAAALAAGAVAALRSRWTQAAVPPTLLNARLAASAQKVNGPAWTRRIGHGILDAGAAVQSLP